MALRPSSLALYKARSAHTSKWSRGWSGSGTSTATPRLHVTHGPMADAGAAAWPPPAIPGCTGRYPARRAPWRRAAPARIPRRPGAPFVGTPRRVLDHLGHGLQAGVAGGVAQRVVHDARAQRIGDRREHHRHLRRHAVRRIHRLRRRRGADVQHGGLGAQQLGGQRVGVGHRAVAVVLRQQDVVAHMKPRLGQASNKAPPIGFQRRMGPNRRLATVGSVAARASATGLPMAAKAQTPKARRPRSGLAAQRLRRFALTPTIIGVSFFRPTSVWVLIDVNCDKRPRCGILQCRSAAALKAGPDRCAGVGEVEPDELILLSKPRLFRPPAPVYQARAAIDSGVTKR